MVERRPGEVMLTDVGREIARRGEAVLTASRDLVDFARHRSGVLTGRLTLGVIPSLAPYLLPRILPPLQSRFPELRLELRETQTRQLIEDIKSGALDAAMLALPVAEPDIDAIALFEDLFLLAVPANDPRRENSAGGGGRHRSKPADPARGRPLPARSGAGVLRERGARPNAPAPAGTVFGASSLTTVMQMVASGYGVTLIPQIAADVERRDDRVKFLRLENPQPGRSIGLVFRRTSPRKADFAALGEVVKESLECRPRHARQRQAGLMFCPLAGEDRQIVRAPCAAAQQKGRLNQPPFRNRNSREPITRRRLRAAELRSSAWPRGPRRSPGRPPSSTGASCRGRRSRAA